MWGFNPKIEKRIKSLALFNILHGNLEIDPFRINIRDGEYFIPANPEYIMRNVPSFNYNYAPEKSDRRTRDCDDAVRIFRGWLSRKNWGNLLAMDCEIMYETGTSHNLIVFLMGDELIYGEPQTGSMIDVDSKTLIIRITA